jgi:hypothetical protein
LLISQPDRIVTRDNTVPLDLTAGRPPCGQKSQTL